MEVSGQLHAPCRFTPKERAPGTHWIGDWVGPRAVLDAVVKRKFPPRIELQNPDRPACSVPVLFLTEYHSMKADRGSGGIAPRMLDLGALPPGKEPPVPFGLEVGWASKPVWTRWWREKFSVLAGTRTPNHPARSPALYHWAIPIHKLQGMAQIGYGSTLCFLCIKYIKWTHDRMVVCPSVHPPRFISESI
jgi:hypothetical protein